MSNKGLNVNETNSRCNIAVEFGRQTRNSNNVILIILS